jgi:hypothetical protein
LIKTKEGRAKVKETLYDVFTPPINKSPSTGGANIKSWIAVAESILEDAGFFNQQNFPK